MGSRILDFRKKVRQEGGDSGRVGRPSGGFVAEWVGELKWQARWFSGGLGRDFVGTDGEQIRVVQFGTWNHTPGPDFVEAAISVNGGAVLRGAIELDMSVSDWERHGHGGNPEYNQVVLHVVVDGSERAQKVEGNESGPRFYTRTLNHRNIPQIRLGLGIAPVLEVVGAGCIAHAGRCSARFAGMSLDDVRQVLREAAAVRFRRKMAGIARARDVHGGSEALYQALAAGLGYSGNELPFMLIAQRLPVAQLSRNGESLESLLFGVAGLIPSPTFAGLSDLAREAARKLWDGWWQHRNLLGRSRLDPSLWRMGRQRPNNHPQRRIAALALICRHWRAVYRLAVDCEWGKLERYLLGLRHPFWSRQVTFQSKVTTCGMRVLGVAKIRELMINAFLPFSGDWLGAQSIKAPEVNLRCRIAAARLFAGREGIGGVLCSAVMQQGLLELYEGFCRVDASDCVQCGFPEQLLHRESIGRIG